jgi:hypothetical protein
VKEKKNASEEQFTKVEKTPRENAAIAIAPMSAEMKEVLTGLARFDLLPEHGQHSEELLLPVISKNITGSRKTQQVSMNRDSLFSNINKQHAVIGTRNRVSSSRYSGSLVYQTQDILKPSPKIFINDVKNESVGSERHVYEPTADSVKRSGRFRSTTYPCRSRVSDSQDQDIIFKRQSHALSRKQINKNDLEERFNELRIEDGIPRPRAATFPCFGEASQSELKENFGSITFRDHSKSSRKESSSSSNDKQLSKTKRAGKTSSRDEMTAIVSRCEEWFQWRDSRK